MKIKWDETEERKGCETCIISLKGVFRYTNSWYTLWLVSIFTCVSEIETMYGRSRVNVKVEPRSTFAFTRGLSYIASISFTRQWKSTLRQPTQITRVILMNAHYNIFYYWYIKRLSARFSRIKRCLERGRKIDRLLSLAQGPEGNSSK